MKTSFTGQEFASALAEGALKDPIVLTGMVKPAEDPEAVLFSLGSSCQQWVSIPVAMIEKVEWLGKVPCFEHRHDSVHLFLKEEVGPVARALANLLRSQVTVLPRAPARLQPQAQLTPGFPAVGLARRRRGTAGPLATSGICNIYVDGQLFWSVELLSEEFCQLNCSSLQSSDPGHNYFCEFFPFA
jgi:hypothetical protein